MHRVWSHLLFAPYCTRRLFPVFQLEQLTQEIAHSELHHRGEIRLVIEGSFSVGKLQAGITSRERAIELFSRYRVWDTEDNTGVLIYLLLAERHIEIVADRGIARCVAQSEWDAICHAMRQAFSHGQFVEGLRIGMTQTTALLAQHFPASAADNPNELPDAPIIL